MGVTTFDFNSSKTRASSFTAALGKHLDVELERKNRLQPRREYLGASALGNPCDRSVQFELAGAPRERTMTPNTLRKIAFGHMSEAWAYQEFKDAGFWLSQHNQYGALYSFSQMDGRFKGHPDGVFLKGPAVEGMGYPCLWEHKGVGSKTFKAVTGSGLKKARPGYYAQVNLYMAYLELTEHPAVFTMTNLDTGEQEHLSIPFDADEAQRATDRAVRIIKATDAEELLPRAFNDENHYVCKGQCDFRERCWRLPK